MGIISWIILGGLAGWIASKFMGTDAKQGVVANVFVGVIGASIGGFVMNIIGSTPVESFSIYGFLVALLGSVILLWILRLITGKKK